jgi:hypothetical protein
MRFRMPKPTPSLGISFAALFVALGGSGYAATLATSSGSSAPVSAAKGGSTANNARHLGGLPPSAFLRSKHFATSNNEKFIIAPASGAKTVTLGKVGHFTFTASCSKDSAGQNQVTFDVTANTTADLDGGGPVAAGTKVNIHTNSDALDNTATSPKHPGDFDQVGSASDSTEIAADGQEVDVFYNDGVNWPAGNGSSAHDCFAGFTGFAG